MVNNHLWGYLVYKGKRPENWITRSIRFLSTRPDLQLGQVTNDARWKGYIVGKVLDSTASLAVKKGGKVISTDKSITVRNCRLRNVTVTVCLHHVIEVTLPLAVRPLLRLT